MSSQPEGDAPNKRTVKNKAKNGPAGDRLCSHWRSPQHDLSSCRFRHPDVCRQYANGQCWKGDNCTFMHVATSKPAPTGRFPCRNFAKGTCRFGDACRYLHNVPPLSPASPSSPAEGEGASEPEGVKYKSDAEMREHERQRKREIREVMSRLTRASTVDLAFLVDCTASMQPYINQVKADIRKVVAELKARHPDIDLHIAFVRYTDFDVGASRTTVLDLTKDVSAFVKFVEEIKAKGGGDSAEDVFGGLLAAMNKLSWHDGGTPVLIHIADAPCHGREFHLHNIGDDYPDGDPSITLEFLMRTLKDRRINTFFGEITKYTQMMIDRFNECLLSLGASNKITVFPANDLSRIFDHIVDSVSESISLSIRSGSDAPLREYVIDDTVPDWDTIPQTKVQVFTASDMNTIDYRNSGLRYEKGTRYLRMASHPFAEGSMRLAYRAQVEYRFINRRTGKPDSNFMESVVKEFKRKSEDANSRKRFLEFLDINSTTVKLATTFNNLLARRSVPETAPDGIPLRFKYVPVHILCLTDPACGTRYLTWETYVEGSFTKYSNNGGFVRSDNELSKLLQCFSHWTYFETTGFLMVVDVQGFLFEDKLEDGTLKLRVRLSDPAIHCENMLRYGKTNLGMSGFERFFRTHECNNYCKELGIDEYLYTPDPNEDINSSVSVDVSRLDTTEVRPPPYSH